MRAFTREHVKKPKSSKRWNEWGANVANGCCTHLSTHDYNEDITIRWSIMFHFSHTHETNERRTSEATKSTSQTKPMNGVGIAFDWYYQINKVQFNWTSNVNDWTTMTGNSDGIAEDNKLLTSHVWAHEATEQCAIRVQKNEESLRRNGKQMKSAYLVLIPFSLEQLFHFSNWSKETAKHL